LLLLLQHYFLLHSCIVINDDHITILMYVLHDLACVHSIFFLNPITLTTTTIYTNKTINETSIINNKLDSKLLDIVDQIEEDAIDITNV
jgi:hypothetical protein